MTKHKKSGAAIFMYCVIALTAITAVAAMLFDRQFIVIQQYN